MNACIRLINTFPALFLPIYWISFLVPRNKEIWVFGSSLGKSFTGNPKYLYLFVNNEDTQIRPIWISRNDYVVSKLKSEGYEAYNILSFKGMLFALCAKVYIFDHFSKDISFWLSGGSIKVNLWHGIPLKKINKDNKFDETRNPSNLYKTLRWTIRRIQNEKPSHYYTATSKIVKDIFESAFRATPERILICGYPRNDILFENEYLINKNQVVVDSYEFYKDINKIKEEGTNVIIYMPTFRASEEQFFEIIKLEKLNQFLRDNNTILLVKAHHMSRITKEFANIRYSNILNIKATDDPYPFLNISDMLITDYSSVYFDFLLTDRPIIFFPYDLEIYRSESRELYYEYDSVTPGPRSENIEELMKSIDDYLKGIDHFKSDRKRVRNMMFDYKDGKSSKRLYEKIINIIN